MTASDTGKPRSLLLINPNTSASITALVARHVDARVGAALRTRAVTARLGAPYIACEASHAVAAHAVLDAWAAALVQGERPQAVLIGCFGDPGLAALRECSPVPVSGLAEASFAEAACVGAGRFAIVTGGVRWAPMLQRLVNELGHGARLAGIRTVAPSGAQLAADPPAAVALLAKACAEAADELGADAVILGGAGLAGLATRVQPAVPVPVIDSVAAGARWALAHAVHTPAPDARCLTAWAGVSPELAALGAAA